MAPAVPTTAVEEADGGSSADDAQPKVNDMPPERVRGVEAGNAADLPSHLDRRPRRHRDTHDHLVPQPGLIRQRNSAFIERDSGADIGLVRGGANRRFSTPCMFRHPSFRE
jgi:hypothetical protein